MAKKETSLISGSIYYLIYNVLNLAFPLVTGIYVARVLLPVDIGEVSAAQNLAQYFVILSFLGIPTYGLREISKLRNDFVERSKVFSELYVINLVSTFVFLTIYIYLIFTIPTYKNEIILYLISGISIALNIFNISWLYEGMEQFRFISFRNMIFKFVCFILLIVLVRGSGDYYWYAAITIIGTAGNYLINMIYLPRYVEFQFHELCFQRHMKSILFLVAVNLAIEIYSLVDITMMNFLTGKDSIAFYKYGHNIQKILLQIINTFTMVLVPRISYYYKENLLGEFNRLLSKVLKIIFIFSIPMIVGIYFTADILVVALYGSSYIVSAGILKCFSLLLLISPIGYLLGSRVLLVTGNENKMVIAVGLGAVINLIGNSILIPLYAEYGATIASILGEIVVTTVYVCLGKRYFRIEGVVLSVAKVCISTCIMSIYLFLVSFLQVNEWFILLIQIIGGIFLYGMIMLILQEDVTTSYFNLFIGSVKRNGR